jgi:fatty-acid O-methyltransferase
MGLFFRIGFNPLAFRLSAKYVYPLATRFMEGDEVTFFNFGYEEDPPMGVPLNAADERNRASIQLYHRAATQADIRGKRVLEVGCGHGGGASYLTRYLHPKSCTGMDLNPRGIALCRRMHRTPGLDFVQGNAQELPFAAETFDVVLNIESSHCYPDFPGFLCEVARVLTPGGHFLYADIRNRGHVAQWEAALADGPLIVVSDSDIHQEVVRGLDELWSSPAMNGLIERRTPLPFRPLVKVGVGRLRHALSSGEVCYRMFDLVKP